MSAETCAIPNDFMLTEVGIIPCDWDVQRFDAIAEIERGKFTARPRNDPKYYGGDIPFIQTGDITNSDGWIRTYSQTLNEKGLRVSKRFPTGTLFFTIAANIGDVALSTFDTACPDSLVAIKARKHISKFWLKQELRRRKTEFENLATHNAQLNINLAKLQPYLLPVPPLAEQEAIAEALGDADAWIESLEQLVAKKRHLKQAAMQQLLTGKKRLPGFKGEWDEWTVGDVIQMSFCGPSPTCEERNVRGEEWGVLKTTAMTWEFGWDWTKHKTLPRIYWNQPEIEVRAGDVIVTKAGPRHRVGVTACVDYVPPRILVSGKMIGLRPIPTKAAGFMLAAAISAREPQQFLDQRTTGMAESQVNFENTALLQTPIVLPKIEEQHAIGEILADMDTEIEALASKLAKARQIKQGMMQELLTGRTRLV